MNLIKFLLQGAFVLFLSGLALQAEGQVCECLNCPLSLPASGLDTCYEREFILNIKGASNNDLSNALQGVCAVNVHFQHNYVWSLTMILVSPDGDSVELIGPSLTSGYASSALSTWDISFIQSQYPPNPDPGFNGVWSNDQLWEVFKKYSGQYHPSKGKLEDFNQGSVNGQWKIILRNCTEIESGNFLNFSIVFCDETGIDCSCQAYGGRLTDDLPWRICKGDSSLALDLKPTFYGSPPDTAIYDYTYILAFQDIIKNYTDSVNLINAIPGKYEVCGFSYTKNHLDSFPTPDGILTIPLLKDQLFSDPPPGCGDISNGCLTIFIGDPLPVQIIDTTMCSGKCYILGIDTFCQSIIARDTFQAYNGCDSIIELRLSILPPATVYLKDTICQGEFVIVGTNFYNQTGFFQNLLKNPLTGCDSLVILDLFVMEIDALAGIPEVLGCMDTIANLNGLLSTYNVVDPLVSWTSSPGGNILLGQDELIAAADQPGTYQLHISKMLANGKICADSVSVQVLTNPLRPELAGPMNMDYCSGSSIHLPSLPIFDLNNLGGLISFYTEPPFISSNLVGPNYLPVNLDSLYAFYQVGWCIDTLLVFFNPVAAPYVSLLPFITICNDDANGAFNTFIHFDSLVVSSNLIGSWSNTDLAPVGGGFPLINFDNVPGPASYTFTWTSVNAPAPCANIQQSMEIFVQNCACPSVATQPPGPFCQSDASIFLQDYESTAEPGHWFIAQQPAGVNPAEIINDSLFIAQKDSGLYKIVFQLDVLPPAGCPDTSTHFFTISWPPVASVLLRDTVCNSAESNTYPVMLDLMTLVTSGDVAGQWVDFDGSGANINGNVADFAGIAGGDYLFVYTTGSAEVPCPESSYQSIITVLECACPPVMPGLMDSTCNDLPSLHLTNYFQQGGAGSWSIIGQPPGSNPATILNMDTLLTIGADAGTYILRFQLINSPGGACVDTALLELELLPAAFAEIKQRDTVCNTSLGTVYSHLLDFNTLIESGDQSGIWLDAMPSGATGSFPVLSFDGVAPGQYPFLYVTGNAIAPCANKTYPMEIIVLDCSCPQFSDTILCNDGSSFDLNSLYDPGFQVNWFIQNTPPGSKPASVMNNILVTDNADPGVYNLLALISNPQGSPCADSAYVEINILSAPELILRLQNIICNAPGPFGNHILSFDSLILAGSGNGVWSDIDITGATGSFPVLDFTNVPPGIYRFVYTVPASMPCLAQTDTIIVSVYTCDCPLAKPALIPPTCNSQSVIDLSLYSQGLAAGTWSIQQLPSGTNNATINGGFFQIQGKDSGAYLLVYSLLQAPPPGCPDTGSVVFILERANDAGSIQDTLELCVLEPSTIALNALLIGADAGGIWQPSINNPGPISGLDPLTGQWDNPGIPDDGIYGVNYILAVNGSCPADSVLLPIQVNELPLANAGVDTLLDCQVPSILLGSGQAPGNNHSQFQWFNNGLMVGNAATYMATSPGMYVLLVEDTNTGCLAIDTVFIQMGNSGPESVEFTLIQPSCTGSDGAISITQVVGGLGPYLYQVGSLPPQSAPFFSGLPAGTYLLSIQDGMGCLLDTLAVLIPDESFAVSLGPDLTITKGSTITLTATINGNPGIITNVSWLPLGIQCPNCLTQDYVVENDGWVSVQVENQAGCLAADELLITVVAAPFRFYIPNAFSPNGDGINDRFTIFGDDQLERIVSLEIFDRWGDALFKAEDFAANDGQQGWDGSWKGKMLDPGVYVYQAVLLLKDGRTRTIKGSVHLVY